VASATARLVDVPRPDLLPAGLALSSNAVIHDALVGLGILAGAALFSAGLRRRRLAGRPVDDRIWFVLAGVLVGGALGGRLGTWLQHLDLRENASLVEQWFYGNRSILSGLFGAYVGALVAKRIVGYRDITGDLFAPAVALAMAIGRVGCLLTELPGTPTSLPWGITLSTATAHRLGAPAGIPLHPSFAYEIVFHLCALVLLLRLRERLAGELLASYLIAYALFRFGVEFVRGNEVVAAGLTRPQWFLLACTPLAGLRLLRRRRPDTAAVPVLEGVRS